MVSSPGRKKPDPFHHMDDAGSIALLVFLYLLQGVPLGLSFGSIPFLLKPKLNYSDLALFSLSSYPYSLKLLWSPIVDSLFFKNFGRRKSWIVPIQLVIGLSMFYLGNHIDDILKQEHLPIQYLSLSFTALVFLCATQDIAVDGWALTLLSDANKTYASTAQTIGLNTGYFLSFTVFLALNSNEFCNKYLRSVPVDEGVVQLGGYLKFWGFMFFCCTIWLVFFRKEKRTFDDGVDDIKTVYKTIWDVCKMKHMRNFIVLLMVAKIGFIANEAVTGLKLLEKGFHKEDLALAVLIDFPFQLLFGYYAAKWSSGPRPLRPWLLAFYGRLAFSLIGMFVVYSFPGDGVTSSYFLLVMVTTILSSFTSTVQFVSMGSFFSKISDPVIGGTYMTLLNTLSNLGGTWPRYFVLTAVESMTDSECSLLGEDGFRFSCVDDKSREFCKSLTQNVTEALPSATNITKLVHGECIILNDGYYTVGTFCFLMGMLTLMFYIRPQTMALEKLPERAWKLAKAKVDDYEVSQKKPSPSVRKRTGNHQK